MTGKKKNQVQEKKHKTLTKYTTRTSDYLLFQDICLHESKTLKDRGKQFKQNIRVQNSQGGKK